MLHLRCYENFYSLLNCAKAVIKGGYFSFLTCRGELPPFGGVFYFFQMCEGSGYISHAHHGLTLGKYKLPG